jgi:hypothetical protein
LCCGAQAPWSSRASRAGFGRADVQFEADTTAISTFLSKGFELVLFDAANRPFSSSSLVAVSSTVIHATFRHIASFSGPFTCVLAPPVGFSLSTSIAVSIDIRKSVHTSAFAPPAITLPHPEPSDTTARPGAPSGPSTVTPEPQPPTSTGRGAADRAPAAGGGGDSGGSHED